MVSGPAWIEQHGFGKRVEQGRKPSVIRVRIWYCWMLLSLRTAIGRSRVAFPTLTI